MIGNLNRFTRTRIAPTPSGYLHLGNILSFGITAALAKTHDINIQLRIDDLDKMRANPGYVQDIFNTLNFLDIAWDKGPIDAAGFENDWSQLHRLDLYNAAIDQLKNTDKLFACTCSRTQYSPQSCHCQERQLPFETPLANWRIIADNCRITVKKLSGEIAEAELPAEMQHFIIRKKDGYPSYQLASVVDDLFYRTDMIVRGEDLWASTLAQQHLAIQLGDTRFGQIAFYHHPLIKDGSGQKLSKSAGATSVKFLREQGYTPTQIFAEILNLAGINEAAGTWQQFIDLLGRKYAFAAGGNLSTIG